MAKERRISMMKGDMVIKTLQLTPEQNEWLREFAYQNEVSQAQVIRELVDKEIKEQEVFNADR